MEYLTNMEIKSLFSIYFIILKYGHYIILMPIYVYYLKHTRFRIETEFQFSKSLHFWPPGNPNQQKKYELLVS